MEVKDRLIVGLDVPDLRQAKTLINILGDHVSFYKIGYQLAFCGGLDLARELIEEGKKVFLDLKLLDIDNTIYNAVANIAQMGVSMLTIHAYPKAMRAAVEAAQGSDLCLLGVTVLTSMDEADLSEAGYCVTPEALVLQRAKDAQKAKMGGIVASAQEAKKIREAIGYTMALVTPGIRLENTQAGDQKRIMSPRKSLEEGASHLVVARPIVQAQDPLKATFSILQEMENAVSIK